jgi:hypothetical protein
MLASDRLLTWVGGPRHGEVYMDEECKLISLCNRVGIGYSGLARIEGMPTHEWIAIGLAKSDCRRSYDVAATLAKECSRVVSEIQCGLRHLTVLIVGWDLFGDPSRLRPHFVLVSNSHDDAGTPVKEPRDTFVSLLGHLPESDGLRLFTIGQPIPVDRETVLIRNIENLIARKVAPKETLRTLVREIHETNAHRFDVGDKILALSIPRASVEKSLTTGTSLMIASHPEDEGATFSYFDPTFNELIQYGPSFACGRVAWSYVKGETSENGDTQSSSIKLLYKRNARGSK